MANVKYTDADGSTRESYSSKAGSAVDPDLSPETLHNDLVTIHGDVDGLEALVTSTNTKLDTVHTDLGTLLPTGTPITGQSLESGGAGGLGWLSSVRKKLSDLIALLPTALGQTTMANSLAVTIASNQSAVPASQSGTWTVQPGNTANTTAWKVDGSAVTQPVSGTVAISSIPAGNNNMGDVDIATKTLAYASGTAASSGDNTLISAPGAGSIYISTIFVQNTTTIATTCLLKDGTTEIFRMLAQNQGDGIRLQFPAGREMKLTAITALKLNLSGANTHNYSVVYFTE